MRFNELITAFILQHKSCSLPGLGTLALSEETASYSVADRLMRPPKLQILFSGDEDEWSDGLVEYVSRHLNCTTESAHNRLKNWIVDEKALLDKGGEIIFPTLGSLQKQNGEIVFLAHTGLILFPEISAERAAHERDSHTVIVGDRETVRELGQPNEIFVETKKEKRFWKVAAIALLILGSAFLVWHFYTGRDFANGMKIESKPPSQTYTIP